MGVVARAIACGVSFATVIILHMVKNAIRKLQEGYFTATRLEPLRSKIISGV